MKINRLFVVASLMLLGTSFGCKKDDSEEIIDVLTSKAWRYGLKDLNTSTNPGGSNLYFAVPECEQDDTFTFKTDGTMVRAYGSKKCDGNIAVNKIVSYSFNKQSKELTIDGVKYTVVEENKTQFKYFIVAPGTTGVNNVIYLLH